MITPVQAATPPSLQFSVMILAISSRAASNPRSYAAGGSTISNGSASGVAVITPRRLVSGFVVIKAREAALTQLRIGDAAALLLHPRFPKSGICPQQPLVLLAFLYILLRGPGLRHIAGARDWRVLHRNGAPLL